MAKRFGGKYSPDPDKLDKLDKLDKQVDPATPGAFMGARVDPVGVRANLLFLPAIPLVFMAFNDGAIGLTLALVAAGFLTLAAWLLRDGLRAEAAFNARKVARRPAFPRKIFASVLTGLGVAVAAYKTEPGFVAPVLLGLIAAGLHSISFGLDPLRDKGMEGIDVHQQNRVARVVDEAEKHLRDMSDAVLRAEDARVTARVEQFQSTARKLFRTVEEDPRDLTGARRYLTVYLQGAADATAKFADIYAHSHNQQARSDYLKLLDDLEKNFAARTEKMLLDDRSDLTVEIEVLQERLQREGVRVD